MTPTGNFYVLSGGLIDFYWTPIKTHHFNSTTRGSLYLEITLLKALRIRAPGRCNVQYLNVSWELQFCLSSVSKSWLTLLSILLSHTFEDSMRGVAILERVLSSKERLAGDVGTTGKHGICLSAQVLFWRPLQHPVSSTHYPSDLISNHSPLAAALQLPWPPRCSSHMPSISMFM